MASEKLNISLSSVNEFLNDTWDTGNYTDKDFAMWLHAFMPELERQSNILHGSEKTFSDIEKAKKFMQFIFNQCQKRELYNQKLSISAQARNGGAGFYTNHTVPTQIFPKQQNVEKKKHT